jgi:diguanylate cyclase (GGDEF)-like protein
METETPAIRRPASPLLWVGLALWTAAGMAVGLLPPSLGVRLGALATMLAVTLLSVGAAGALAARRARGPDRRLWAVIAGVFGAGGLVMLPWLVPGGGGSAETWATPGTTSLAEAAMAMLTVLVFGAALGWALYRIAPVSRADAGRPWQWLFDILLGLVALFVLAWYGVSAIGPLVGFTPIERSVGALIVAESIPLVLAALAVAWALRAGPDSRRALAVAVALLAASLTLWPWWFESRSGVGEPFTAEVVEVLWLLAVGTIAIAGYYRSREPSRTPWVVTDRLPGRWRALSVALLPTALAVVVAFVGALALDPALPADERRLAMVVGLLLVAATIARGALSAIDREDMLSLIRSDPLTGLFNARYFSERLAEEMAAARADGRPMSIVSVDLDDFAGVNAACGPAAADDVLAGIGRALRGEQSSELLIARTGGDGFGMIMLGATESEAAENAAAILRLVAATGVPACRTTGSAGVAELSDADIEPGDLVERADRALYWAKYRGKDAVAVWNPRLMGRRFDEVRPQLAERRARMALVRSLAAVNDSRVPTRAGHSRSVADLAGMLAREIGLDEERVATLEAAALLHDIGIVCVPDEVLDRPGPLSPEERDLLEEHPGVGERIVSGTELAHVGPWIAAHHERWDGTGYPRALFGEGIPLEARIIAVCDAFDGATSGRPHHGPRDWRAGVRVVSEGMGGAYDPALAERFIALMVARGASA